MSKKGSKIVAKKPEVESCNDTSHLEYTQMCSFFAVGKCLRGENCKFAHSPLQIRQKPDLTRTSLCHDFMRKRSCKNGDRCRYAHGEKELHRKRSERSGPGATVATVATAATSGMAPGTALGTAPGAAPAMPSVALAPLAWDPIGLSELSISASSSATSPPAMFPLMQKLMTKRNMPKAKPELPELPELPEFGKMGRFISPELEWPPAWRDMAFSDLHDLKRLMQFPSHLLADSKDPCKVVMHQNGRISCALDSGPKTFEFPMHINTDFVRCYSEPARV